MQWTFCWIAKNDKCKNLVSVNMTFENLLLPNKIKFLDLKQILFRFDIVKMMVPPANSSNSYEKLGPIKLL